MKRLLLAASVFAVSGISASKSPEEEFIDSVQIGREMPNQEKQEFIEKLRKLRHFCRDEYPKDTNARRDCMEFFSSRDLIETVESHPSQASKLFKAYRNYINS